MATNANMKMAKQYLTNMIKCASHSVVVGMPPDTTKHDVETIRKFALTFPGVKSAKVDRTACVVEMKS